jgi:hypothetical protein
MIINICISFPSVILSVTKDLISLENRFLTAEFGMAKGLILS